MAQLIQIFYQPRQVFEYVREHRIWLFALVANMILLAAFTGVVQEQIGMTNIMRQNLESGFGGKNMPADQKEAAIAAADTPARKAIGIVATGVVVGIVMMIVALLYMAIAGISGGPIKFSQAAGTATYSAWPFTLITVLLSLVVVFISPDRTVLDPQHLLAFNAGAFLDKATTSKPLYAFASSIDVLILAQLVFAGWGLSIVAKIAFGRALGGMIAIWVVMTLLKMGASLFF